MTTLKCAVCSGTNLFGPTHACGNNYGNPVEADLVFTEVATGERSYTGEPTRGTLCLDCGHVALFVSEAKLIKMRERVGELHPIVDKD